MAQICGHDIGVNHIYVILGFFLSSASSFLLRGGAAHHGLSGRALHLARS